MNKLVIGYFYPGQLNLYGDRGNVEILCSRAAKREIEVEVLEIGVDTDLSAETMQRINLVFMGGGPDSGQVQVYDDLIKNKAPFLKDFVEGGGVGLYVCGSYQLLGEYYKPAEGSVLEGLGVFGLYTQHFGNDRPRCVGNVVCEINPTLLEDDVFKAVNRVGSTLVGFENHGGRTYLNKCTPLAKIVVGHGNNSEDGTEGAHYKNSVGTYLHGPILSKNPHLADFLIAKASGCDDLPSLDDFLVISAHTASKKLKQ